MKFNDVYNEYLNYRYHTGHKKVALQALENIEKDTNFKLSSKEKKKIKEYAKEHFGSSLYAYWLFVYTAYNQQFKEGWIPDNYFGQVVAPHINSGIGKVSNLKTLSKKLTQSSLLPDKLYKINNVFYDENLDYIEEKYIKDYLFFGKEQEYFVKKDNSSQGRGVIKINHESFNLEFLKTLEDFVVQRSIQQHPWFDEIIKGSVATVRVTTVRKNNNIETRASYLRVGRKDSTFIQSASNIRVPIINNNGELGEFASDVNWRRLYKHPDSGFIFSGNTIPGFSDAIKKLEEIHKTFPHFSIIGWDVSITESGHPEIIEWNGGHPDIKFTEAAIGPAFKDLNWERFGTKIDK